MLCPCFKFESGLKKPDMHVGRKTAFFCHTCKSHARLWLMHAKVFEKESKTNNDINLFSCIIFLIFLFFN